MTTVSDEDAEFSRALNQLVDSYVTRFTSDMIHLAKKRTYPRSNPRHVEKVTSSFVESTLKPFLNEQARLHRHDVLLAASLFGDSSVDTSFEFSKYREDWSSRFTLDKGVNTADEESLDEYVSLGMDVLDNRNRMVNWNIPLAVGQEKDDMDQVDEEGGSFERNEEDEVDEIEGEESDDHNVADHYRLHHGSTSPKTRFSSTHSTGGGKPLEVLTQIPE